MGVLDAEKLGLSVCGAGYSNGHVEIVSETKEVEKPLLVINDSVRDVLVKEGLVPEARRNNLFSGERVKENIARMQKEINFEVVDLDSYLQLVEGLIGMFRQRIIPPRSYLIGAPASFGKTAFVMTSLFYLRMAGYSLVPYWSLSEIAELKLENDTRLLAGAEKFTATKKYNYGRYRMSDVLNADILFTYLTDASSKELESITLKHLIDVRGVKGLPTICFSSMALDAYRVNPELARLVWNEILDLGNSPALDKLTYKACFKSDNYGFGF